MSGRVRVMRVVLVVAQKLVPWRIVVIAWAEGRSVITH